MMLLPHFPPATAGRDHKNVSNLGKKCPVYKICKFFFFPLLTEVFFTAIYETLSLKMNFSSETRQSKLSRLPAYLTVQMVRFFYKEKESVNAKVLKVRLQYHSFPPTRDQKNSTRTRFLLFVLKDVKFPLMLDVYELCTAELQERMLPIRSKFKEMEDKKLEKLQQKVRVVAFLSFSLKLALTFFKKNSVQLPTTCIVFVCALGDEEA